MPTLRHILPALLLTTVADAPADEMAYIDTPVDELSYHLRLEAPRVKTATCTMIWNYTDSANYTSIVFDIQPRIDNDPFFGFESTYSLRRTTAGTDSILDAGTFASHYPTGKTIGMSAVLKVYGDRAYINLGGTRCDLSVPVPFDANAPGGIGYRTSTALKELRNDIRLRSLPATERASFADIDELTAYLSSSTDPAEGFWRYLDRDTDPDKASLGGLYTLATVAEPGGKYAIIYLDGATTRGHWQPMMIKGRLIPTIFTDHFDLEWRDAAGRAVDNETSASIELNGSVLRLDFPLHSSTIRFSKVKTRNE